MIPASAHGTSVESEQSGPVATITRPAARKAKSKLIIALTPYLVPILILAMIAARPAISRCS